MTTFAQDERSALCDTFIELGPDAPTLCEGWRTRDLAAHLVVRERRPDAAAGMFVKPLAERADRIQRGIADGDWDELVATVRKGAPRWNPMSLNKVDETANLGEFFIHHEDVLRAQPNFTPREYSDELQRALFGVLPNLAKITTMKSKVGLVADCGEYGRRAIHKPRKGRGYVVLSGLPSEIVLTVYGRGQVADVKVDGAAADVEAYDPSVFGF